MAEIRRFQSNFTGGMISGETSSNINLKMYENGAKLLENVYVKPQGGVCSRGGMKFDAEIIDEPRQLEPFNFSDDQAYLFIFRALNVDIFHKDGTFAMTLAGPWTAEKVGKLSVVQQLDTMFVAHPAMRTQVITRTGAASFAIAPFDFERTLRGGAEQPPAQPYWKFMRPEVTMEIFFLSDALGGTTFPLSQGYAFGDNVMLRCSVPFWTAGHVGNFIKLDDDGGTIQVNSITNEFDALGTVRSQSLWLKMLPNAVKIVEGVDWCEMLDPYHNFLVADDVYLSNGEKPNADQYGTAIGWEPVQGPQNVTAVGPNAWRYVGGLSKFPTASGQVGGSNLRVWAGRMRTTKWKEGAFSDARGWPGVVAFHDQRLVMAGSTLLPHFMFFSRSGAFFNFDAGTGRDDEAIIAQTPPEFGVPKILWLLSYRHLLIFTDLGEFFVPGSENKAVTPATISVKRQTPYGANALIHPAAFDGCAIYVVKDSPQVQQFSFEVEENAYLGDSLTHLAGEIVIEPVDMDVLQMGLTGQAMNAFVVNADGTMGVLTYSKAQEIVAWTRWRTEGEIKNVCVVQDRTFFVVRRTIAAAEKLYLEHYDHFLDLDCVVFSEPTPGTKTAAHFAPHMANHVGAWVVTNDWPINVGNPVGTFTIGPAGEVLGVPYLFNAQIGLLFTCPCETLRPEVALPDGPTPGLYRHVSMVTMDLRRSTHFELRGRPVLPRRNNPGEPLEAFTGIRRKSLLGWDRKGEVAFGMSVPGHFELNGINITVEF